MTAPEKALIRLAIKLIHTEDDYYGGMNILWKLIGEGPSEAQKAVDIIEEVSIKEIREGPLGPFEFGDEDDEERKPVGFDYKNKQQWNKK